MSQRYSLGVRTSNITTGQALLEIIAATVLNGGKGCRVLNFRTTMATAPATVIGMGRPAVAGVTPTTPVKFQSNENSESGSLTTLALAWATSPTAPTNFLHRATMPSSVGGDHDIIPVVALYGGGWWVPAGGTLVLFNILGGATLDVSIDILE